MEERAWHYGCLFCRTGEEKSVAGYINQTQTGIEAIVPMRTRRKAVAGKVIEDKVLLLPGYIFFRTENAAQFSRLTRSSNVLKLLEYDNLNWEPTGSNREFAKFLFDDELLQPPHVIFINGKRHFEDGFLHGYNDAVLRVNRRKKTVEIRLGIDRLMLWIKYNE